MALENGNPPKQADGLADVLSSISTDAEKLADEPSFSALRDRVDAFPQAQALDSLQVILQK